MSTLLCKISNAFYDIQEILRRITPIEYCHTCIPDDESNCHSMNGTLIIDSNAFIYGQLSFPKCDGSAVGTTINGDGIKTGYINADTGYIHDLTVDYLTIKKGGGMTGATGPAGNSKIDVIDVNLTGDEPWDDDGISKTILTVDLPTAGVWQIIVKLSLFNDTGNFLNVNSVTYGIGTDTLTTSYYTPMAPTQYLSYEFVQIVQVTLAPETVDFNVTVEYNPDVSRGVFSVDYTNLTAVRLGDIA